MRRAELAKAGWAGWAGCSPGRTPDRCPAPSEDSSASTPLFRSQRRQGKVARTADAVLDAPHRRRDATVASRLPASALRRMHARPALSIFQVQLAIVSESARRTQTNKKWLRNESIDASARLWNCCFMRGVQVAELVHVVSQLPYDGPGAVASVPSKRVPRPTPFCRGQSKPDSSATSHHPAAVCAGQQSRRSASRTVDRERPLADHLEAEGGHAGVLLDAPVGARDRDRVLQRRVLRSAKGNVAARGQPALRGCDGALVRVKGEPVRVGQEALEGGRPGEAAATVSAMTARWTYAW